MDSQDQVLYYGFLADLYTEKDLKNFFKQYLFIDNKRIGDIASYFCHGFISDESSEDLYNLLKEHWIYSRKIGTLNKLKAITFA